MSSTKCTICDLYACQCLEAPRLVGADRNSPLVLESKIGHNHPHDVDCTVECVAHPSWQACTKMALRPRNSAERKAEPIHSGVLMYFPDALAAIARLSNKANQKHNPGDPLGWTRSKSNDHMDCSIRHSLTLQAVDVETGEAEGVAHAWRALAQLQLDEEKRLKAAGIMPYSGIVP